MVDKYGEYYHIRLASLHYVFYVAHQFIFFYKFVNLFLHLHLLSSWVLSHIITLECLWCAPSETNYLAMFDRNVLCFSEVEGDYLEHTHIKCICTLAS